ncbi:MAG: M23 family metallopeptidase [Bacteroidota bacterium]
MKQLLSKLQKRLFVYSDDSSGFREIENWLKKFVGVFSISALIGIAGTFVISYFLFSSKNLQTAYTEDATIKNKISEMAEQMAELRENLKSVSAQNNQLRMSVDLPVIDKTSQQAPSGGGVLVNEFELSQSENGASLSSMLEQMNSFKNQIELQKQSYSQIKKKYDYNKKFFASLPSLKPMEGSYSPTGFGMRMHPVLGMYKTHIGLDILNDIGTPIYAAADGVVEFSGKNNGGYGFVIEIDHGFGYKTLYAHCSKLLVKEGKRVRRGEMIAKSGRSGLVTGPHLHYEVSLNGVKQNPVDFFYDTIASSYRTKNIASK